MELSTRDGNVRVNYRQAVNFVDIGWVEKYECNALLLRSFDAFNYWALVCFRNEFDGVRMVLFPDKSWFDEWYMGLENKPEIISKKSDFYGGDKQ